MNMNEVDKLLPVNIFRITIGCSTVLGNCFLLYLFYKFPRLRHSQANLLLIFINIYDLLIGIGITDRGIYAIYATANNITLFDRMTCLNVSSIQSSAITGMQAMIIAISVDRCLAVFKPVRYAKNDSRLFVYCAAAISIACSAVLSVIYRVNVDPIPVTVCSTGAAQTALYAMANQIYSTIFLILLF
uniref:G-protein coupled receptors family 1 profile domain-containing protein n=1 Tax=Panagrolaimus sp. JU765 TaxID=591449 RepID=A0AC34QBQ9_9BILA